MPLFKVQWDGMGFTTRESMTEKELTEAQAARYTRRLQMVGELPEGVVGVVAASVSPDEKEVGEWKVFVSVTIIVEAKSLPEVERSEPPEEFLLQVASKMIGRDANASYGVGGTFEILDAEPCEAPPGSVQLPKKRWIASQLRNNPHSRVPHTILDAFVVGSVAEGTARPDSDPDIAIIIPASNRVSALQQTERYHAKFTEETQKPQWDGRRVDFQFFYANDPQLANFSKIPRCSPAA